MLPPSVAPAYAHIGRLPNPENDAVDLSVALRRLGFEGT